MIKPQPDCTDQEHYNNPFTGYFRDGITRIDLVCVIRPRYCRGCTKLRCKCSRVRHGLIREYFTRLVALGMALEIEQGLMPEHQHLTFIKIHAPDEFIDRHGEYFLYAKDFQDRHAEYILPNRTPNSIFPWPAVSLEKAYLGLIRESYPGDTSYSTLDRSRIVYEYLLNTKFRLKYMACEYTHCLTDMLRERMILDAYALHDGPYFLLKYQNVEQVTGRQVLFENWTGLTNMVVKQPLHIINEYLGEKVSLFFGFYGLYTFGLIFPATCGIVGFFWDWLRNPNRSPVTEYICNTSKVVWPTTLFTEHWYPCTTSNFRLNFSKYVDNVYVCPNCRHYSLCPYKEIHGYCDESKMIDSIETPMKMEIVPVLVFIWANILIKMWKNSENYYIWIWEVNADHVKNLFRIHCKGLEHDLDTSFARRCCMLIWNIIQLVCIIFAAILMLYALLEYRYYLYEQFQRLQWQGVDWVWYCYNRWRYTWTVDWKRKYYVYMFLGMNHMLIVFIIESLSKLILHYVTKWEQHETRKQKENAMALRLFSISFVFTFILIMYTAFIKGQFYTHPVDDDNWYNLSGLLMENCHPLTCTDEVLVLVMAMVVVRELVLKFLPYFWFVGAKSDYSDNLCLRKYPYYERERLMYTDEETDEFIMRKYHEIVIQFASVTMFVGVFPLGPVFALVTNMIDLRFCARRILIRSRRPMLHKAESIGIWRRMMFFLVFMIALCNTMLLVITSDQVQRHLDLQNNEETEVFDHIDYYKRNITYIDFTLFNGHNGHVDKSITFGHITMKLFTEYNYRMYENRDADSPLHEYTNYIIPNEYWIRDNTICDYTMPHDHPINRTHYYNCSFVYSNTLRRHCYYRGFSKRYATSTQRGVNVWNKTRQVFSWDSKPWDGHYGALGRVYYKDNYERFYETNGPILHLNDKYYYTWYYTTNIPYNDEHGVPCSFANFLYGTRWRWRWWRYLDLYKITHWEFDLRYYADVFHYYGEAVNWQDVYISHMKWLYFVSYVVLGIIVLVFIYFCLPDMGSDVFEAYASERHLGRDYEKKSEPRQRQKVITKKEEKGKEKKDKGKKVGSDKASERTKKAEPHKAKEKVA